MRSWRSMPNVLSRTRVVNTCIVHESELSTSSAARRDSGYQLQVCLTERSKHERAAGPARRPERQTLRAFRRACSFASGRLRKGQLGGCISQAGAAPIRLFRSESRARRASRCSRGHAIAHWFGAARVRPADAYEVPRNRRHPWTHESKTPLTVGDWCPSDAVLNEIAA